jgi:hypothetical protein
VTGELVKGAVTGELVKGAVTGELVKGAVTGELVKGAVTGELVKGVGAGVMTRGGGTRARAGVWTGTRSATGAGADRELNITQQAIHTAQSMHNIPMTPAAFMAPSGATSDIYYTHSFSTS